MIPGVEVLRGAIPECFHRVHVAVTDADGALVASAGEPHRVAFLRSAAKPFQALPIVEEGIADRYGLEDPELAICCASHSGEAGHLERVGEILGRLGLTAGDLACGPHPPLRPEAARGTLARGEAFGTLHNNCSGKHAGMLALASAMGWPTLGYHEAEHPVQRRMALEVSRWTRVPPEQIGRAVDGCGVQTFAVPLDAMAGAFARLGAAAARGEEGPARIVGAMTEHPHLVGGTGRLDTDVMRRTEGRIVMKGGAEGVVCGAIPDRELGVALKVEDGAGRAAAPAFLRTLRLLELLDEAEAAELSEPRVRQTNTRDEVVGRLEARIRLERR